VKTDAEDDRPTLPPPPIEHDIAMQVAMCDRLETRLHEERRKLYELRRKQEELCPVSRIKQRATQTLWRLNALMER
jgi:hypothetical protein